MKMNIKDYWDIRYKQGGDSGSGSRGELLAWKAKIINDFIKSKKIKSVNDFGCGKGDLAMLLEVNEYNGFDISLEALKLCPLIQGKSFAQQPEFIPQKELSLSIDVLFHCVDQADYDQYLSDLFHSASKFVIIYAYDHNVDGSSKFAGHYYPRKFTTDIEIMYPQWKLIKTVKQKYPVSKFGPEFGSYSDFYIYQRIK
jgi:SAM-dependent methyltransferase